MMLLLPIPDNTGITNFDSKMTELNQHGIWYFYKNWSTLVHAGFLEGGL